jgi:hypothetical protein
MYLTYDMSQTTSDPTEKQPVLKGAKEFSVPGKMIDWEVGEFETESGANAYGVKVNYMDQEGQFSSLVIEAPASAKNVLVHTDHIPKEYRAALDSAA